MAEVPLTVGDIAEMLDVSRQQAHAYTKQGDFPKPIDDRPRRRRWSRRSIERWAERRGRPLKSAS